MLDTRTPADKARDVARAAGWDLESYAAEHEWAGVAIGPVGQHRDSDPLELSNFRVVYVDLQTRFGDAVDTAMFGHWAVGWVEEIAWDASRADVAAAVEEWRAALDNYPVADESDYSELEWEHDHPGDGYCYSDDPDCGCASERRA